MAEDGRLGACIFNSIVVQIKKFKNSPLEWSIVLLSIFVVRLMPHEDVSWGMGFAIHGEGVCQKMTPSRSGDEVSLLCWTSESWWSNAIKDRLSGMIGHPFLTPLWVWTWSLGL